MPRLAEIRAVAGRSLGGRVRLSSTVLVPFYFALKSARRHPDLSRVNTQIDALRRQLVDYQRRDLRELTVFFRAGGLRSPLLGSGA